MHGDLVTDLVRQYAAPTPASGDCSGQFRQHLPGAETRSITYFEPYPVVVTDLVVMGKLIGGDFRVGAIAGRRDLMELTSAARPGSLQGSATFNGNVITMATDAASLIALDETPITALNQRAAGLAGRIGAAAKRAGMPMSVTRAGSILHVHLLAEPPLNAEQARAVPAHWQAALHLALLLAGVYAAPHGMLNLSTAMTDDDLDVITAAARLRCSGSGTWRARGRCPYSGDRK